MHYRETDVLDMPTSPGKTVAEQHNHRGVMALWFEGSMSANSSIIEPTRAQWMSTAEVVSCNRHRAQAKR